MNELPENLSAHQKSNDSVFLDGYLRFIPLDNVAQYAELLKRSSLWDGGIPFAVTAFCDVLVWEEDGYILLYRLIDGQCQVMLSSSKLFFDVIADKEYQRDYFNLDAYCQAKEKLGELRHDQCYIFEPIPALGGAKSSKELVVGETLPYLAILCETT